MKYQLWLLSSTACFQDALPLNLTNKNRKHPKIYFKGRGGLGNLMFQCAALSSIAQHHGATPVIHPELYGNLSQLFTLEIIGQTYLVGESPSHMEVVVNDTIITGLPYQSSFLNMNIEHDIALFNFFQSWKYFRGREKNIREMFAIRQNIKQTAVKFYRWITDVAGLHAEYYYISGCTRAARGYRPSDPIRPGLILSQGNGLLQDKLQESHFHCHL